MATYLTSRSKAVHQGGGIKVLNTTPSTIDGGLWLENGIGAPVINLHWGGSDYNLTTATSIAEKRLLLTFDSIPTTDVCGNEWTASGSPTVNSTNAISENALQLDGASYLRSVDPIVFGGRDFTLHFYAYTGSSTPNYSTFFHACAEPTNISSGRKGELAIGVVSQRAFYTIGNNTGSNVNDYYQYEKDSESPAITDSRHHFAFVYTQVAQTILFFIDGVLYDKQQRAISRMPRYCAIGSNFFDLSQYGIVGSIDEMILIDGIVLWTSDFTPPTASDYPDFTSSTASNTIQSGSSGGGNVYISNLNTVSSNNDGDFWLDVTDGTPILKLHKGNFNYAFNYTGLEYTGSTNLVSYLSFDVSPTMDISGKKWFIADSTTTGDNGYDSGRIGLTHYGNVWLDSSIKKFGKHSLHCVNNGCIIAKNIIDMTADKWSFDLWIYNTQDWTIANNDPFAFDTDYGSGWLRYGILLANRFIVAGANDNWQYAPEESIFVTDDTNQWIHFAAVKNGNTFLAFKNGQLIQSATLTENIRTGGCFWLGASPYSIAGNIAMDVYIDSVRFFNGEALWTQNFTPPTAADYT